jgi:hypothetical protein
MAASRPRQDDGREKAVVTPRIEPATEGYALPEGALGLSKFGWRYGLLDVVYIQPQPPYSLAQALDLVQREHGGLLGPGDLVFKLIEEHPHPKGYLVFIPSDG